MKIKLQEWLVKVVKPLSLWLNGFYVLWVGLLVGVVIGANPEVHVAIIVMFSCVSVLIASLLVMFILGIKWKGKGFKIQEWILWILIPFIYWFCNRKDVY